MSNLEIIMATASRISGFAKLRPAQILNPPPVFYKKRLSAFILKTVFFSIRVGRIITTKHSPYGKNDPDLAATENSRRFVMLPSSSLISISFI